MYKYLFSNNNNKLIIYNYFQIVLNHSSSLSTNTPQVQVQEKKEEVLGENIQEDQENIEEIDISQIYNSNLGDFEYDLCQEKEKEKKKQVNTQIEIYDIYDDTNISLDELNPMKNQE